MHKKTRIYFRKLDYELLMKETKVLAKDDQRSLTFLATHDSAFANCFPVSSDPNSNFDNREFETALAREVGLPVKYFCPMSVRVSGPTEIHM